MNVLRNSMFVTVCCAKQIQDQPLQLRTSKLSQPAAECMKSTVNYNAGHKTCINCSSLHKIYSKLQLKARSLQQISDPGTTSQ